MTCSDSNLVSRVFLFVLCRVQEEEEEEEDIYGGTTDDEQEETTNKGISHEMKGQERYGLSVILQTVENNKDFFLEKVCGQTN